MIYGILGVLVVLVAACVAVASLVPLDAYKPQIAERVKQATGRDLRIDGAMRLSVFPRVELDLADVGLSNQPGGKAKEIVTLDKLRLVLRVLPLLSGRVEVQSLVLDQPTIALETDEKGNANWRASASQSAVAAVSPSATRSLVSELRLEDVRIEGGTLLWNDARGGASQQLNAVDLRIALRSLDEPLKAEGSLSWKQKDVRLDVELERPRAWLDGGSSKASLRLKAYTVDFRFQGDVVNASPPALVGAVDAFVPSIRDLARWFGVEVAASGTTFGAVGIQGDLSLAGSKLDLRKARVRIDEIETTGELKVDVSGSRARFEGSLAIPEAAIDPYLGSASDGQQAGSVQWSDERLILDRLRAFDASLDLAFGRARAGGLTVGKSLVGMKLERGLLSVDLREVALYDGNVTGSVQVKADADGTTALDVQLHAKGCQTAPLLRDAARFDRLSGAGDLDLAVNTRGSSERELVAGLRGRGKFELENGAIRGINLVGMVTHVATAFTRGETDRTEFKEMRGSFTIDRGVVSNDDLVLSSELIQTEGAGTVNLSTATVDYRVSPRFVAPLVGQLGLGSPGVTVPVLIRGPWSELRYEPDLAGLAKNVVDMPASVLKGVVDLPGRIGKGIFGK